MAPFIQERSAPASWWAANNPILSVGEIGYDTTNGITRTGDGATPWASLPNTVTGGSTSNNNPITSATVTAIVTLTSSAYAALSPPDPGTLYLLTS